MDFRTPSRILWPRTRMKIFMGLVLFAAIWLLGATVSIGKGGLESPSPGFPEAVGQNTEASKRAIKKQYALALAEYYAGEYAKAQRLFIGIADLVPGYLSDDIQFWRAECAFRLGNLETAGTGFRVFLGQGAQGPRAEIALKRLSLLESWGG